MDGNDRALMVGAVAVVLLVWAWSNNRALQTENSRLQAELHQTQQQFEAFRQGVLSNGR